MNWWLAVPIVTFVAITAFLLSPYAPGGGFLGGLDRGIDCQVTLQALFGRSRESAVPVPGTTFTLANKTSLVTGADGKATFMGKTWTLYQIHASRPEFQEEDELRRTSGEDECPYETRIYMKSTTWTPPSSSPEVEIPVEEIEESLPEEGEPEPEPEPEVQSIPTEPIIVGGSSENFNLMIYMVAIVAIISVIIAWRLKR